MGKLGTLQFVLLLAALAAVAAFLELGRRDVLEDNEGQRATPPAEMLRSGDYVIPTLNGKDYLSKPPLLYWAIAGVYSLTGTISPFTARIPTALTYMALVFAVYLVGRRYLGETAGRWGALAMLTSPYVMQRGRYAELDIPLTLAVFLCIVAAHKASQAKTRRGSVLYAVPGGIALAAAIMLKGPVPFLFLGAAFIAQLMTLDGVQPLTFKQGLRAARFIGIALALALAAWAFGLVGALMGRSSGIFNYATPLALVLVVAAWLAPAWRKAGGDKWRCLGVFSLIILLGVLIVAPWGASVLSRKGLTYVINLLHAESLERTHTATAINSGSPLYYFVGLLGMLLPWGLLLPCQFSPKAWGRGPAFYRFAVLTGWLSLLIFSLIAGKEYEYVLPATPLLLLAVGWQLAMRREVQFERPILKWYDIWQGLMLILLTIASLGFLVAVYIKSPAMAIPATCFGLVAMAAAVAAWRRFDVRPSAIAIMALCGAMLWLLSQDYRHTGRRSFRPMAEAAGRLVQKGYDLEAVKMTAAFDVFPGFAFHAGTHVPATTDAESVKQKLLGKTPYYCVLRKKLLESNAIELPPDLLVPRMGPMGAKDLIIIGNQPLPGDAQLD